MILPDLILCSRVNQHWAESGLDSYKDCLDRDHFLSYPYTVTYDYNSRGFRDKEWPDSINELKNSVWCIGDSFTVGLGSPVEHTWPYQVGKKLNTRTINVSMDGASNDWIARRATDIVNSVSPKKIIIMWSYLNRRESSNTSESDENRKIQYDNVFADGDVENFYNCVKQINQLSVECIHFIIPRTSPAPSFEELYPPLQYTWDKIRDCSWPKKVPVTDEEYNQLPDYVLEEIRNFHKLENYFREYFKKNTNTWNYSMSCVVKKYGGVVNQIDRARDGHHFDILTSSWVADKVDQFWNQ